MNTDRALADVLGNNWIEDGPAAMVPFSERTQSNPVLWIASNCQDMDEESKLNNRTQYVEDPLFKNPSPTLAPTLTPISVTTLEDLMKYVGLDSLGSCLPNRCPLH
jgi:hypothetical protein